MRRFRRLLIGLLVVAGGAHCRAEAGDMRAAVDPATGKLLPRERAAAEATPQPRAATPPAPLVETPVPGGGARVELDDRFRRPLVARVAPDGSVRVDHEGPAVR